MENPISSRRRFLVAALTFSGIAVSPAVLRTSSVWAQSGNAPGDAMVRMARSLLPHDDIDDDVYAGILDDAMAATAADDSIAATLREAEAALPADFMSLDGAAQVAALQAVQDETFFAAIIVTVRTRLYDHPAVWKVLGYEGPSWQKGGYLNRGTGDIDWLPEGE